MTIKGEEETRRKRKERRGWKGRWERGKGGKGKKEKGGRRREKKEEGGRRGDGGGGTKEV